MDVKKVVLHNYIIPKAWPPVFSSLELGTRVVFYSPYKAGTGSYVFGMVTKNGTHGKMCRLYHNKVISNTADCITENNIIQADWTNPCMELPLYWVSDFLQKPCGHEVLKKYPSEHSYMYNFVGLYDDDACYVDKFVDGF
jgi:hypothetical protein